jgi:glycosyltransferase involved in cell wall biosynthesis
MTKVSITIPVYNTITYLKHCLDSVAAQTYPELEVVLVDDGSTDGSASFCDDYGKKDKRFTVLHTDHAGLSHARNTGLLVSSGDLISFVDSDDWIGPDTYAPLVDCFEKTQADIVLFGYYKVLNAGQAYQFQKKYSQDGFLDSDHDLNSFDALCFLLGDYYIKNYVWDKVYRRELFSTIRFTDGRNFEDIDIMYKLILACRKIHVLGSHYRYYYRQRAKSISHSVSLSNQMDYFGAVIKRYKALRKVSHKRYMRGTSKILNV